MREEEREGGRERPRDRRDGVEEEGGYSHPHFCALVKLSRTASTSPAAGILACLWREQPQFQLEHTNSYQPETICSHCHNMRIHLSVICFVGTQ